MIPFGLKETKYIDFGDAFKVRIGITAYTLVDHFAQRA